MNYKNAKYNANGTIDCEIEHPVYGWIPTTLSATDPENSELFAVVDADPTTAPYVQSLADAKTEKLAEIESAYNAAIVAAVPYLGTTFEADEYSQNLITRVLVASGGSLPADFFWVDSTNQQVVMTYAELQGLANAILLRGQQAFVHRQQLKATVDSAASIPEVNSVVW